MKLHEFVCRDCNKEFEELLQDSSEICCPNCNSKNVRKLLSAVKTSQPDAGASASGSACSPSSGFS
ncbi:MAG: FmdB family zinc ribbon protein [Thermodesulfobacteriota bacterium]